MNAHYEPTDVSSLTTDLVSIFRSATERANLELLVDCPKLDGEVFVDKDMWEKVVMNLLSNALKYTLSGSIDVRLRPIRGAPCFMSLRNVFIRDRLSVVRLVY